MTSIVCSKKPIESQLAKSAEGLSHVLQGICLTMLAVITWSMHSGTFWLLSRQEQWGVALILTGLWMVVLVLYQQLDWEDWLYGAVVVLLAGGWMTAWIETFWFGASVVVLTWVKYGVPLFAGIGMVVFGLWFVLLQDAVRDLFMQAVKQ